MSSDTHPPLLGVNIDHAATLRQARYREEPRTCGGMIEPDPVAIAQLAERAGADGITAHLREDRRHMQDEDLHRLRACLQSRLNFEMACTEAMVAFALALKPDSVCLVPEGRAEVTTEGGLDVRGQLARVKEVTAAMNEAGIVTSLFIDPDPAQVDAAAEAGAPCIELHTGTYARAFYHADNRRTELEKLQRATVQANGLDLLVNAGHGISYVNVATLCTIPLLHELNIGHAILARSLFTGMEEAVREMKARMHHA